MTAIHEDRQGALWIGTVGGLNELVRGRSSGASPADQERFVRYQHDPDDPYSLSDDDVTSILQDSTGILWVGTGNGLNRFVPSPGSGQVPSPGSGQVRFIHYWHDPNDPHSLSDDAVVSLYEDQSGVLWMATANGVSKYIRRTNQFMYVRQSSDLSPGVFRPSESSILWEGSELPGLSDSRVLEIYEDRAGVLWIGTPRGGLNRLDRKAGMLTVYQHDPADPDSLSSNTVTAIYEDQAGVLWVGTGNGWLERFDPQTETFAHVRYLGEAAVQVIVEDGLGNLWLGTSMEGVYRLGPDREAMVHYEQFWRDPDHWRKHGSLSSHIIEAIHVDQAGVPWIGTYHGGINLWDSAHDRFTHYRHDPSDPNSLSHRHVLSFCEDPAHYEGMVWIGTMGGGLNRFDRATQTFTHYTVEDGLSDDTVGCILADDAGFLWLSTPQGLSRFDPRTETFRNYDERDGVLSGGVVPQWAPEVCLRSESGEMFFGGSNGLYVFDPEQVEENLYVPPIAITALKINNQTVWTDVPADEHIRLAHYDNFVSFEFAALDHTIPEKNQYAYVMEGLDRDWVYVGTRRHADYPDLRPGDYVFRVKGSNNDGVWNEEGVAVRITVEPPVWETWGFRVMAAAALVLGTIGVYRQRVRNVEVRSRELESQVEERTAELQQEIEQRLQVEETLRQRERQQAVVAERNRLARELHDSVTQSLYAVTLYADAAARLLSSGQGELASDNVHKLRRTAKEALAEMRLLIFELRPPILEDEGLAAALQARLEAVEGRSGLRTELHVDGERRLPPKVEDGLYRIAREALNNALKHAQARGITVSLHLGPGATVLEVADDGAGFDPGAVQDSGGIGRRSMAERAEAIGAGFEIESQVGGGTRVVVVWEEAKEQ